VLLVCFVIDSTLSGAVSIGLLYVNPIGPHPKSLSQSWERDFKQFLLPFSQGWEKGLGFDVSAQPNGMKAEWSLQKRFFEYALGPYRTKG
jgi:hypothetical protein